MAKISQETINRVWESRVFTDVKRRKKRDENQKTIFEEMKELRKRSSKN
jgi:hypothetical protein